VWGLVHSFISISETQVANITTIAPGIAEALITTLAGLIIAIPALIMFNYLQTHIRHLEHSMLIFVDKMISIMQQLRGK
jgi:biopolymer transport protein ExbB/TolQ